MTSGCHTSSEKLPLFLGCGRKGRPVHRLRQWPCVNRLQKRYCCVRSHLTREGSVPTAQGSGRALEPEGEKGQGTAWPPSQGAAQAQGKTEGDGCSRPLGVPTLERKCRTLLLLRKRCQLEERAPCSNEPPPQSLTLSASQRHTTLCHLLLESCQTRTWVSNRAARKCL